MVSRLVLGCGTLGYDVVEAVTEWSGDVTVIVDDPSRVESLRSENVDAREEDPTDASAYPAHVTTVIAASDDPERNLAAIRAARDHYADPLLVAYAPTETDAAVRDGMADVANRVVDATHALAARIETVATGDRAERLVRLFGILRSLRGPLAVVMHDNPDPDAIASAIALVRLAESVGVDAEACYFGEISHQENRALVNLLDLSLRNLEDPESVREEYGGIALVDHSRPGVNDRLPTDVNVDIVIDHHPPREPVAARFVDLRSEVGATSTLLAEYLERSQVTLDESVATALLYGIRIDTRDFMREVSNVDFDAAATLVDHADLSLLERVESPSMSPDVLETLAEAITHRDLRNGALATCVGEIHDRDALAQAAEYLLDMEGVNVSLVYGFMDGTVYVSGRTRGAGIDLGETLREALGQIGSAGGHADMAGAQIPLGILADVGEESSEALRSVVEDVITDRFFETLDTAPDLPGEGSTGYDYATEE